MSLFSSLNRVKKRPLYLGLTMCLSAVGMFLIAAPHFLGRHQRVLLDDDGSSHLSNTTDASKSDICLTERQSSCNQDHPTKDIGSLVIIFIGIFLVGIGVSFYYSFGIPYVDDNSGKTQSPFLLSVVAAARTLGPTVGYVLGGLCIKIYVEPAKRPKDIDEDDPRQISNKLVQNKRIIIINVPFLSRWIGAWWAGFLICASGVLLLSPLITLFPPKLPGNKKTDAHKQSDEKSKEPSSAKEWLQELKDVGLRLITNKIWIINLVICSKIFGTYISLLCRLLISSQASTAFLLFGFIGFATFIPKYFEYHFRYLSGP